jgi:alpha,alpha-trehalase
MSNTAIADHALLSDRHSTALVDRSGSVDWLGFPRFDSPSVFGRLLGPDAGHWSITPGEDWSSARRYVDRTLVLETTFTTATGVSCHCLSRSAARLTADRQLEAATG